MTVFFSRNNSKTVLVGNSYENTFCKVQSLLSFCQVAKSSFTLARLLRFEWISKSRPALTHILTYSLLTVKKNLRAMVISNVKLLTRLQYSPGAYWQGYENTKIYFCGRRSKDFFYFFFF